MGKDESGKDLVAGALYCAFEISLFTTVPDKDGVMLYWTGLQLVTQDGSDADHVEYDYLVRQNAPINPDMVESVV